MLSSNAGPGEAVQGLGPSQDLVRGLQSSLGWYQLQVRQLAL